MAGSNSHNKIFVALPARRWIASARSLMRATRPSCCWYRSNCWRWSASASAWPWSCVRCWSRISRSSPAISSVMWRLPGGRGSLAEQPPYLRQGGDERVDLLVGVVEGDRRAAGGRHTEVLHQRMRTVVAGAHGDSLQVEKRGEVVRMRAFDQKAHDGRLRRCRPEDTHAVDLRHGLGEVREQVGFTRSDV